MKVTPQIVENLLAILPDFKEFLDVVLCSVDLFLNLLNFMTTGLLDELDHFAKATSSDLQVPDVTDAVAEIGFHAQGLSSLNPMLLEISLHSRELSLDPVLLCLSLLHLVDEREEQSTYYLLHFCHSDEVVEGLGDVTALDDTIWLLLAVLLLYPYVHHCGSDGVTARHLLLGHF